MIAITIGIMSMIPGSLGSFDLIMVSGLVGLGIDIQAPKLVTCISIILLYSPFYESCFILKNMVAD